MGKQKHLISTYDDERWWYEKISDCQVGEHTPSYYTDFSYLVTRIKFLKYFHIVALLYYEILPKSEIKTIKKWSDFGGFSSLEVREKKSRNYQIHLFGFHCEEINIEGWFKNLYFISSL